MPSAETSAPFLEALYWTHDGCPLRQGCAAVWLVVSVSAPCRDTALHLASRNGHTETVKALLEMDADVDAENIKKCAFPCGLVLDGRRLHAPARLCAVRVVVSVSV